ncbi:MAG: hypothetical protein LLF94_06955 [Chlamydiales bacterium]|nr:hypothetical protein [Chlamydiales bacterium]
MINEAFLHPLHSHARAVPSKDFVEFEKYCKGMGLLYPPYVPDNEKAHFKKSQDGVFGTIEPKFDLYDIDAFVTECTSKPYKDFIVAGTAGHGLASQGFHYYAKKGPLYVFVQINEASDKKRIDGLLLGAEKLYKAAADKNLGAKHFLVVHSDFKHANGWGWHEGLIEIIDENTWHKAGADCISQALKEFIK